MQTSQGSLSILEAHTESPKVYWNGAQVPVVDVGVSNHFVVLRVLQSVSVPADLESNDGVKIKRVP